MQSNAWNEYYIENNGYDWDGVAEDEDGDKLFTKTEVENAISNLDYVIQKALPDVLSALFDEGMISLDFLTGVEDYANGSGLWALLKGLLSTNVLTDDFINMVANGLFGLIGGASGTLDAVLNLYLDESMCEDEIVEEGYDRDLVQMVIRKVRQNEWKRLQFAPQLKVSPMSFGLDRRWPIS